MSVFHRCSGAVFEAVDEKGFHPQPGSTRIADSRWKSVASSTIHSTYYYY